MRDSGTGGNNKFRKWRPNPSDPTKTKLTNPAEILESLLGNAMDPLGESFARWKMSLNWTELVGPTLGAVSKPTDLRGGVLKVAVKSAAWMQELHYSKYDILEALQQKLPDLQIRDLHFYVSF